MVDVALVDLHLPDGNETEVVRDLRATNPHGQTIVLTADTEQVHHANALAVGAAGVVSTSAQPSEIVAAIRRAHAGEMVQPAQEILALVRLAGPERTHPRWAGDTGAVDPARVGVAGVAGVAGGGSR
jgi:DNA-binding NarL/FixJ family response regulator